MKINHARRRRNGQEIAMNLFNINLKGKEEIEYVEWSWLAQQIN